MIKKNNEKIAAIDLRKQGFSYNEILQKIPVAKSTLSVWLRNIGIAKKQTQRLTEKRKAAQKKAHQACRNNRIKKTTSIISQAKSEVKKISHKELWFIGTALYWAEGSKQKETNVSQGVSFGNSDPQMILLFHKWMHECCNIPKERFDYRIYIHESADTEKARKFWNNLLNEKIEKIHLKKHNPKTLALHANNDYNGLLRIDITKSTDLNRKIKGWILGINENLK